MVMGQGGWLRGLGAWDRFVSARSRDRHLPSRLLAHMPDDGEILDVGTFDGRIARDLMDRNPALTITGADPRAPALTHIPVVQCAGSDLPFPDGAFEVVMLVDVLHHDLDPAAIIAEALRVSGGRVVIKDHYWESRCDWWILAISDYLGNRAHGIPLAYNFLRFEQWREMFAQLGASVETTETFTFSTFDRCKQVIFVVREGLSATDQTARE